MRLRSARVLRTHRLAHLSARSWTLILLFLPAALVALFGFWLLLEHPLCSEAWLHPRRWRSDSHYTDAAVACTALVLMSAFANLALPSAATSMRTPESEQLLQLVLPELAATAHLLLFAASVAFGVRLGFARRSLSEWFGVALLQGPAATDDHRRDRIWWAGPGVRNRIAD